MLGDRFRRLKQGTESLNYGRETIVQMVQQQVAGLPESAPLQVLDVGFGSGTDLLNIKEALPGRSIGLFGVDSHPARFAEASERGIAAVQLDIESERLPFDDQFFDVVIANQIIEHTKQIFWIVSEISRVLKKSGWLIVGVPNLAALHNRILLALGEQPSSVELLGPHVRGFTKNSLVRFITADNYFRVLQVRGANFYLFPKAIARPLSRWLPTLSVVLIMLCQRTEKQGTFIQVLKDRFYETDYFQGN
jgi:ubiquinone/menaquinone biosynthesis C-methylase UbiE